MKHESNYTKGVLAAAITALLWGFLPIVLKISLSDLSPVDVSWVRFAVAFTLLMIYQLIRKPTALRILIRPPLLLVLASACLSMNYLGLISGVDMTTPAIAEVFIQSGAIFLAMTGFLFFREKASLRQIIGLLIVITGLAVFYRDQFLVLADNIIEYQRGVGLTLFAGFMWCCYAILQKGLVKKTDPLELNLVLFGLPAIGFLPFVNFSAFANVSFGMWGILIFLGANTLIAYGGIAYALKFLDASRVSVIVTTNPIITFSTLAILMAMEVSWIEDENFTLISITGALLVVIGAVLTIWRKSSRK